jgi:16S rRNA processing protein RimM
LIGFGRVAGSYGVRGWLRVAVDEPGVLAAEPVWWLEGAQYPVQETKVHSGSLLAKLQGIETPEQAKALKGRAVQIPRPEAGEGRYYWDDLVGLEVVNAQGMVLGVVKGMFSNGAHDVMELAGTKEDSGQRLLPFVPAYVKKVDLPGRRIEVEWEADW